MATLVSFPLSSKAHFNKGRKQTERSSYQLSGPCAIITERVPFSVREECKHGRRGHHKGRMKIDHRQKSINRCNGCIVQCRKEDKYTLQTISTRGIIRNNQADPSNASTHSSNVTESNHRNRRLCVLDA